MKEREAVEWLRKAKGNREALEMAVSALETSKLFMVGNKRYACGNCGMVVQTGNKRRCTYYCDYCGRKIEWESAGLNVAEENGNANVGK